MLSRTCLLLCLLWIVACIAQQQEVITVQPPVRTTDKWDWKSCSSPDAIVEIESIQVTPDPPQPGKNLTVEVKGWTAEQVEEGATADVLVKLGLIKLLQRTIDVCEEARNANASIQCPVAQGSHTVTHTVELPKEIPKAKFVVDIKAYTVDERELFCLNLVVDFMIRLPRLGW